MSSKALSGLKLMGEDLARVNCHKRGDDPDRMVLDDLTRMGHPKALHRGGLPLWQAIMEQNNYWLDRSTAT